VVEVLEKLKGWAGHEDTLKQPKTSDLARSTQKGSSRQCLPTVLLVLTPRGGRVFRYL